MPVQVKLLMQGTLIFSQHEQGLFSSETGSQAAALLQVKLEMSALSLLRFQTPTPSSFVKGRPRALAQQLPN
jgi:hypothetical protein